MDLDETLFHFEENQNDYEEPEYYIRPGLFSFLNELSEWFEIVIFTAADRDYAQYFVEKIDPHNNVSHILSRQHCIVNQET